MASFAVSMMILADSLILIASALVNKCGPNPCVFSLAVSTPKRQYHIWKNLLHFVFIISVLKKNKTNGKNKMQKKR